MTLPRFRSRDAATPAATPDSTPAGSAEPSVHVVTFGCQMNKYDSLLVEGRFVKSGYRVTADLDDADVVLFNTCSVREHAEERALSWVGELKRAKERRPDLVVGVMGCFAQRAQDEIFRRAPHVDVVCGTRRFQHLPELVAEVRARRGSPDARRRSDMRVLDAGMDDEVAVARAGEPYTGGLHGYLAVMRGCDLNCTYCIVPRTRGRVQSRPIADLVDEARWMVGGGCRAITLLGQTVNSYGEDLAAPGPGERGRGRGGRPSLADLIEALQGVEGLARIRLVTLHAAYVTRALAEALRDCDKADRFLPLPAQSGSDRILRAMKRGYTTDLYRERVELLRSIVPDVELGSDWIVGFPSETDADHAASESFLAEIGFVQNYVFKYDPRPETAAHERADDVSASTKKARNQALLALSERVGLARMQAHLGRELDVFVEQVRERDRALVLGRTRHNLPISLAGDPSLVGTTVRAVANDASAYGLAGALAGAGAQTSGA